TAQYASECATTYVVVECTTMSAPSASGCCRYGEANVLSTTTTAPTECARSATAAMSTIFSSGFVGVSTHTTPGPRVSAFSTVSRSLRSAYSNAYPWPASTFEKSRYVPP